MYGSSQPQQSPAQPLLPEKSSKFGGGFLPGDRGKMDQYGAAPELSWEHSGGIACVAWVIFSSILLAFGFAYHSSYVEIWTLLTLGIVVMVMIIYQNMRQMEESPFSKFSIIVAGWLLAAILLGTLVGVISYDCCIGEYWEKQKLEMRENVLPSEPAAAFMNVGEIIFADEARVDPSRAVGYKDGKVYCVAPIASDFAFETVQFWAAGTDCCGSRDSFVCDDAWNPKAHAGVVIRNDTKWSKLREDVHKMYHKAVKLAEQTYDIASAEEPIFVRWVSNPEKVEFNMWSAGLGVVLAAIIIAALLCALQAVGMYFCINKRRSFRR